MLNLRWFMLFLLLNVLLCSYGDFLPACQRLLLCMISDAWHPSLPLHGAES